MSNIYDDTNGNGFGDATIYVRKDIDSKNRSKYIKKIGIRTKTKTDININNTRQ